MNIEESNKEMKEYKLLGIRKLFHAYRSKLYGTSFNIHNTWNQWCCLRYALGNKPGTKTRLLNIKMAHTFSSNSFPFETGSDQNASINRRMWIDISLIRVLIWVVEDQEEGVQRKE
eukprot:46164_1